MTVTPEEIARHIPLIRQSHPMLPPALDDTVCVHDDAPWPCHARRLWDENERFRLENERLRGVLKDAKDVLREWTALAVELGHEAQRRRKGADDWFSMASATRAQIKDIDALASPSPHTEEPAPCFPGTHVLERMVCRVCGFVDEPAPTQQPKATHKYTVCPCSLLTPKHCGWVDQARGKTCCLLASDPIHAHTEEPRT